jgi:hypothetical protein
VAEGTKGRPRRVGLAAACAATFAAAWIACADFEGLALKDSTPDASTTSVAMPVLSVCKDALPPPRPTIGSTSGTIDFAVAVHHVDMGDHADAAPETIGYDLDDTCTTADAGASCIPPSSAGIVPTDGPNGIDNATSLLLRAAPGNATGSVETNSNADVGQMTVAIQVLGYNDSAVEAMVGVAYYGVTFHPEPDGGAAKPIWDGSDSWDVFSQWLADPGDGGAPSLDAPLYVDPQAWVTPGPTGNPTLVSELPGPVLFGSAEYHLRDVVLTADIVPAGRGYSLANGIIAGRVRIDELLQGLRFGNAPDGMPFCQGTLAYAAAKSATCAFPDIHYGGDDNGSQPCDAASWAWRILDAALITLAGVRVEAPPAGKPCPPGTSPADDHCAP